MVLPRFALLPLFAFLSLQAFGAPTILPIVFEPNEGRWDPGVKFSARTGDYRLFLTARGASLTANQRTVSISLLNANRHPEISGVDALPLRTNYFLTRRRRTGAPCRIMGAYATD